MVFTGSTTATGAGRSAPVPEPPPGAPAQTARHSEPQRGVRGARTTRSSTLWRRWVICTHRWLGIAGSLLFVSWFASGIVLMYAGMPALSPEERLTRAPRLDLASAQVGVSESAVRAGFTPDRILVGMHGDRPVYRFAGAGGWATVYADTGDLAQGLGNEAAVAVVRHRLPEHAETAYHDGLLTEPDQWTLQSGAFFPLHRVRVNDAADTVLYVSDRTLEPVMQTTRQSRRWAWLGAVPHWLYFTPLRARATLWSDLVIWLSILGCVLCGSGLVRGLWRVSASAVYRLRGVASYSPYAGMMRWHHYAGLVFSLFAFTWVFSGGLSMEPWSWHPGTAPTRLQRQAVSGGPPRLGPLTAPRLRAAVEAIAASFDPQEIEVLQFRGEPYLLARNPGAWTTAGATLPVTLAPLASQAQDQVLVPAAHPERGTFARFEDDAFDGVAAQAMPGAAILDATWLRAYDAYYYDRSGRRRLPVLRVRYDDAASTWLYFNPYRGTIDRKEERLTRANRWLYHGLHSLDFPFLHTRRPLWDVVVIALSLGGMLVSVTSLGQRWRRLRRHAGRRRFS